jgi:hypothetical protein
VLREEGSSCGGEPYDGSSMLRIEHEEPAIIGIFPDGESGAGRAPRFHHFFVTSILSREPLQKIQDQALYYGIAHRSSVAILPPGRIRSQQDAAC